MIVLVPEIGLTPQALARFSARFGERVAVIHSGLAAGERRDEWHRLRSRRGDGLRRTALGRLRAGRRPRPRRRRRGARLLLQAGGRPPLRRPRRRRPPRRRRRRGPRRRLGDAAGRELGAARADRPRRAGRRRADAGGRGRRHARSRRPRRPAPRADPGRAGRRSPSARRQGDRARQPPRLLAVDLLRRLRPRLGVPRVRRLARPPPGQRPALPPLRLSQPGAVRVPGVRLGRADPRRRRQRAGRGADRRGGRAGAGLPARLRQRRPRRRAPRDPLALPGRRDGRPRRHPDGRQGPRLPRRRARRRPRRRRDAAGSPTSAPRSGRSRSSPSSPAAAAAGRGAAR